MRHYLLSITSAVCALQSGIVVSSAPAYATGDIPAQERWPVSAASGTGSQGVSGVDQATAALHGINNNPNNLPTSSSSSIENGTKEGTDVSSAPGADAMMTPDFLLVNPSKTGAPPKPLQSFVGQTLKLSLDRFDITLPKLRGLMVTVTNDTNRPLVINGDAAQAVLGTQTYTAASVRILQKSILPSNSFKAGTVRTIAQVVPAAVTVGLTPTAEDYIRMKQPVRKRYGTDEKRRFAESSRFGKRILWPHQKTQGILYFQTDAQMTGAKLQIPVQTLFDAPDSAVLTI